MRIIKQAERAWNKVYTDIPLPADWKMLDRSFSLLPDEVQQIIALTAQEYRKATLDRLELVNSHKDLRKGDRIRVHYIGGEIVELTIGSIGTGGVIQTPNIVIGYNEEQMRVYRIMPPVELPDPAQHPHIIDRHDGSAWVWAEGTSRYIAIGSDGARDPEHFDDWEPARSVAVDA